MTTQSSAASLSTQIIHVAGASEPWWRHAVIYQIYPRSFADANGDGTGDLRGITSRLEHLQKLGGVAILLSPFLNSPHKDVGYDVAAYRGAMLLFVNHA